VFAKIWALFTQIAANYAKKLFKKLILRKSAVFFRREWVKMAKK
jgi:hypothetical protein